MNAAHRIPLRADIQTLRGFAVVAVILYHAGLGLVPGGFLGVDLFFVISGFLIGGHVLREQDKGLFSFASFYLRRVRRLAPAAYVMVSFCLVVGALILTRDQHARFTAQALGVLTYTTNVVLWQQINYFNTAATSEPLLHMWSLAIEEQFYLLLPLALWVLPRSFRKAGIGFATIVSLALYLAVYPRSPGAAFYLLPTRAWELGVGVGAAVLATQGTVRGVSRWLALPAFVLVFGPMLVPAPVDQHWLALPACVGAALILLAELPPSGLLVPIARAGDASYSLYLVHWPLFAFAHVLWLGDEPPAPTRLGLVALSGLLGWLSWRWIEQPGRFVPMASVRVFALYVATTLLLVGLALGAGAIVRGRPARIDLAGVSGLDAPGCDATAARFDGRCQVGVTPDLLVWGDSFSQQLMPAFQSDGVRSVVQASKGQCAPLLGLAPVDRDATLGFARDCLSFNRSVLDYLGRTPSVRVVVLSGNYSRYAQPGTRTLRSDGSLWLADLNDVVTAQRETSAAIRALGKRVVVVTGPVQARFDVGQCWARKLGGLPAFAPAADCAITPAGTAPSAAWNAALFASLPGKAATPVLRLDRLLCPETALCPTSMEGVPLYRDPNHLGLAGSKMVGRRFGLAHMAKSLAR